MNWNDWLLWGLVATVVLSTVMSSSQRFGMSRMSMPYMVGSMLTPSRDRAQMVGFFIHVLNGWVFSLLYVAAFHSWGRAAWYLGSAVGLVHAVFVLTVGMRMLPAVHPRMASERYGPTVSRQLEPPGYLALNYGPQTPVSVTVAHLLFGAILGTFYRLPA